MIGSATDGLGWRLELVCQLMKSFHWSPEFVRKRLPGAQAMAYYCWAVENEASVWGSGLERKTPGYVKQEWQKRMAKHG